MPGKTLRFILAGILSVLVLLGGTVGYIHYQLSVEVPEDTVFLIEPGTNLSVITKRLVGENLLPVDDFVFKAFALVTRSTGPIRAGQYQLTTGMDSREVLALFRSGKVIQHRITFPEGLQFSQWQQILQEAPYLKMKSQQMTGQELRDWLELDGPIEGWLFPDTYHYILGDSDIDILKLAVLRMHKVLDEEWPARALTTLSTRYEALILASIIEKETGYEPDRLKVASVFHNRLTRNMRLQSDPTVIFGLGAAFDGDLKRSDLRADTPYNTYTRKGLPPTPICSPGRASIKAALAGSSHPYFYFVAMGNGRSYFSVGLDEHNNAVNQYQKNIQP